MIELDPYDQEALARIRRRVQISTETGCWIWPGVRNPRGTGYGQMKYRGESRRVHRVAYELTVGPIPEGMQLDHFACDNASCCNPDHLRPVTPRENVLRANSIQSANAAKRHCSSGHEMTPENTMLRPKGGRRCRACHILFSRAGRARQKKAGTR